MKKLINISEKYLALEVELNKMFIGREDEIRAFILAHASMTHAVLLGDPGTGKSALARKFAEAFPSSDATIPFFEWSLNNFSKPADGFGPVNIEKLNKENVLENCIENFLPNARIGFLNELSRGEAVMNSLLEIVNERTFSMNGKKINCPIEMVIADTNFKFSSNEFEAMKDRFLQWLNPVRIDEEDEDDLFKLWDTEDDVPIVTKISQDELKVVRAEVKAVEVTVETKQAFRSILIELKKAQEIKVSNRRSKRIIRSLVKSNAWLNGRSVTLPEDLECVWTALWEDETQIAKVKSAIRKFVNPQADEIQGVIDNTLVTMQGFGENPTEFPADKVSKILQGYRKQLVKLTKNLSPKNAKEFAKADFVVDKFQETISNIISVKTKGNIL